MVAGISGTGAGSGAAVGAEEEKEGRLMLLHAPSKTASAETIPRLAAIRARPEPIMFSPKQIRRRTRPAAKRKNLIWQRRRKYAVASMWFPKASYMSLTHQGIKTAFA
jgi:hypothetical protein